MKRAALALAALLVPQVASAGVGVTGFLGATEYASGGPFAGAGFTSFLPTIDYRSGRHAFQFAALDLIDGIARGEDLAVYRLQVAYYNTTSRGKVTEDWKGIFAPGASVLYLGNGEDNFNLVGRARVGVQTAKKMGVGLYVVPGLGVGSYSDGNDNTDDLTLIMHGSIQLSVWSGE